MNKSDISSSQKTRYNELPNKLFFFWRLWLARIYLCVCFSNYECTWLYVCVCVLLCTRSCKFCVFPSWSSLWLWLLLLISFSFLFINIFFSLVNLIYCVFLSFLLFLLLSSLNLSHPTYTLLPNFIFNTMHTLNSWKINRETSQKKNQIHFFVFKKVYHDIELITQLIVLYFRLLP
jgi:hypothetical protein